MSILKPSGESWIQVGDIRISINRELPDKTTAKEALSLTVWPCAYALTSYLYEESRKLRIDAATKAIELGAGAVPLPSLFLEASITGFHITTTDAVSNTQLIKRLDWSCPQSIKSYPANSFDLLLGSDLFYDEQDYDDILATTRYLLRKPAAPESPASKKRKYTSAPPAKAIFSIHIRDSCTPLILTGYFRRWNFTSRLLRKIDGSRGIPETTIISSSSVSLDSSIKSSTVLIYEISPS